MAVENSKKFLCPNCGELELEDVVGEFKCRNCGYEIQIREPFSFVFIIYLLPILIYFFITILLCLYMALDTFYFILSSYCPNEEFMTKFISKTVLYILLSLAIMDLNALLSKQYVSRIDFKRGILGIPIPDNMGKETDEKKLIKDDRRYISKVIVISVVLILMHTFYIILTHPDHEGLSVGGCIIGASAVLIAVGVWKVLDSKSD